jgi:serine protease Do
MANKKLSVGLFCLINLLSYNAFSSSLPDFTDLVEEHSESVVNISTISYVDQTSQFQSEMNQLPEIFKHFFGDVPEHRGDPSQKGKKQLQSMGSGFIVSEDGIVLTNNHVIDGVDEIYVRFNDRRELRAKLIGSDERSDLAVLKVEADDLPAVKLGNSKKLKVGEWVFAIGSPFGFDYTVTAGIVSAKGRSLPNESYVPFIQTDVAINPGNSGGPLFNMEGEVVGINSQIFTRSGGFMGVSFAIPIDVAMEVVNQLNDQGYVSRGWLGVLIQEVSKGLAESFGLDRPYGALVSQVLKGSPADDAGINTGDVIIEYNGEEISYSSELPQLVGRTRVDEKVALVVMRNGKEKTLTLKIGELPSVDKPASEIAKSKAKKSNKLGVNVKLLDEQTLAAMNLDAGVQVTQVLGQPASAAGIRQGDIISRLNNQRFTTMSEFLRVVENLPSNRFVPVLIVRQGNPLFIVIKVKG